MALELALLLSLGEMFADFQFIIKIFVLMTIIGFVKNHLGTGPLSILVMSVMFIFIFGDFWKFFGGIYLLYMLLMLGVSHILIDFFFVGGMQPPAGEVQSGPMSSGADMAGRRAAMDQARRQMQRGRGMMR